MKKARGTIVRYLAGCRGYRRHTVKHDYIDNSHGNFNIFDIPCFRVYSAHFYLIICLISGVPIIQSWERVNDLFSCQRNAQRHGFKYESETAHVTMVVLYVYQTFYIGFGCLIITRHTSLCMHRLQGHLWPVVTRMTVWCKLCHLLELKCLTWW